MDELFGLSMNVIMAVLVAIFLVAMVVVLLMAVRNRIMLKMGVRPIPRRLGQTILIIVGVMLSTVIISAAFGTGDTVSVSVRNEALRSLKTMDEVIVPARADASYSFASIPFVPYERFEQFQHDVADMDDIDGLTPQIGETVPSVNPKSALGEGFLRVVGLDPALLDGFGTFELTTGDEVALDALQDGEAFINDEAADELEAVTGDDIQLFIEGEILTMSVKGVVEDGGLAGRNPTLIVPLELAQRMFRRPGEINIILVSNRGDATGGVNPNPPIHTGGRREDSGRV